MRVMAVGEAVRRVATGTVVLPNQDDCPASRRVPSPQNDASATTTGGPIQWNGQWHGHCSVRLCIDWTLRKESICGVTGIEGRSPRPQ